jgi:hypothetical protein
MRFSTDRHIAIVCCMPFTQIKIGAVGAAALSWLSVVA